MKKAVYQNPLLPGFYPDPAICRVDEDYYMVTSSFTVFPGLPLFHSRDLANWEQVGHALDRPEQLTLDAYWHSGGIYAPTLRYYNNRFYLVCTNVGAGGHFFLTAERAEGPWSDAVYLEGEGIDPDLFLDKDGRFWFTATRSKPNARYFGDNEIWMREFDPDKSCLVGDTHVIWGGYAQNAVWPEAPHIYYKDPYYYVLTAEGGTAHEHAVMIGRSKSLFGPYEACHQNPILTHRHLGKGFPVVNVGHADLVETQNGDWYLVALASRPYGGYYRNLGREAYIAEVSWEDGWPVVNAGHGRLLKSGTINLAEHKPKAASESYVIDFEHNPVWDERMICIRGHQFKDAFSFNEGEGLRLLASPERLDLPGSPSAVFIRQQHMALDLTVDTKWPDNMKPGVSFGLTAFQDNHYYYRTALRYISDQTFELALYRRMGGEEECLESFRISHGPGSGKYLRFTLGIRGQDLRFGCVIGVSEVAFETIADGRILSPDYSGSFLGTVLGAYIQVDGKLEMISRTDEEEFYRNRNCRVNSDISWDLRTITYTRIDHM